MAPINIDTSFTIFNVLEVKIETLKIFKIAQTGNAVVLDSFQRMVIDNLPIFYEISPTAKTQL